MNLKLLPEFKFLYEDKNPSIAVVAARGAGKTVAVCQYVISTLLTFPQRNCSAVMITSSHKQAVNTLGAAINKIVEDYPSAFCDYNSHSNCYTFNISKIDKRKIHLLTYEMDEKSLRGYHPETVLVLDECASMPHDLLGTVVMPMRTPTTKLIAIGTAQGKNKFYELFRRGCDINFPDWSSYMLKAEQCSKLTTEFLVTAKNNMTDFEYAQEYDCDFNANVLVGSVFGDIFNNFTNKNIRDDIAWDPKLPVYTSWDIGISDYTAIWFFQVSKDIVKFIDYHEDNGKMLSSYADVLLRKPYSYKLCILPHDGSNRSILGSPIIEQLTNFGFKCEIINRMPLNDNKDTGRQGSINIARDFLVNCHFAKEPCALGIEHLKMFKYKINRTTGLKTNQFEHNEHSHGADAFRYAACSKHLWQDRHIPGVWYNNPSVKYADY